MANTELRREPAAVKNFFDAVGQAAKGESNAGRMSVTAGAAAAVLADGNIKVPVAVSDLLGKYKPEAHGAILDSVLQGSEKYKREHGYMPDPSLIEFAIRSAHQSTLPLQQLTEGKIRLDNASSTHHDQLSLQPATAIVAILAQLAEAIPYAAYLPADVKNNEARLAILSHLAYSDMGEYLTGALLDGTAGGGNYLDSERVCLLSSNGGGGTALTYQVTQKYAPATVGGIAVAAGNVALPLLRGRTVLLVNGLPAGRETGNYGSGSNTIAGSVIIAATSYALSGTVNSDTGAISITSTPALPAGVYLEALAYIDYEKAPTYAPKVGIDATIYQLFARPSRGIVQTGIDASTQIQSELNIDPRGQALLGLRAQYAQERHYRSNAKMLRVASNLSDTWAYGYSSQILQKTRSDIWQNLVPIVAGLSQKMASVTMDHGITTLYLTGELAAQARGLPSTLWEPSGVVDRPGIYRLGRLFGQYDVYYTPKGLIESGGGDVSQILCVGRGSQVGRNPMVLGDAVPPVFLPLAMGTDMVQGDGFYTRNFTEINPHPPSAQGAALINVTGIKS